MDFGIYNQKNRHIVKITTIKESQASISVNSKDEMISKNNNQLPLINLFNKKSFFANFLYHLKSVNTLNKKN